jgi:plasmid stabilization system protein ParE
MSHELVVAPSAKRDIAEADAYYARFGKADQFLAAIDQTFERIMQRPLVFAVVYQDVRRALLRRFPFCVFFVVESERAVVLAVHHHRRNPAKRPRRP